MKWKKGRKNHASTPGLVMQKLFPDGMLLAGELEKQNTT